MRVHGVVGRSIKVHLYDLVVGDILCIRDSELDPIIERIERLGELIRLHYKKRSEVLAQESLWLDPKNGEFIFIHDLHNERAEFLQMAETR